MSMKRNSLKSRRARRVRAKIFGTALRPRLSIFRSARYLYAQLVDDETGKTLVACDSRKIKGGRNNVDTAKKMGEEIAKIASTKKIKEVVFDRHGYKYHGKVKSLAEGARNAGLKF